MTDQATEQHPDLAGVLSEYKQWQDNLAHAEAFHENEAKWMRERLHESARDVLEQWLKHNRPELKIGMPVVAWHRPDDEQPTLGQLSSTAVIGLNDDGEIASVRLMVHPLQGNKLQSPHGWKREAWYSKNAWPAAEVTPIDWIGRRV